MEVIRRKAKGQPKGGWPSVIAKREAKKAAKANVPWALQKPSPAEQLDAASKPDGSWAMGEDEPPVLVQPAKVQKDEPLKVVADEILPHEVPATTFSFALQHVGQNLWRVVMLKHLGDKITERKFVSHGDLKGNALARLRFMVYQLWFNERMPSDEAELVPTQPTMHG